MKKFNFPQQLKFLAIPFFILALVLAIFNFPKAQNDKNKPKTPKAPETADEFYDAGRALQIEEKFDEARPLMQNALNLYATAEDWNNVAKTVYYATRNCNCEVGGEFDGSVLEPSIQQLQPLLPDTSYWLGKLYFGLGMDYRNAKKDITNPKDIVKRYLKSTKLLTLAKNIFEKANKLEEVLETDFFIARNVKWAYEGKDKIIGFQATLTALLDVATRARVLDCKSPLRIEIRENIIKNFTPNSELARAFIIEEKKLLLDAKEWGSYVETSYLLSQSYYSLQDYPSMKQQLNEATQVIDKEKITTEQEYVIGNTYYALGTYYRTVGDLESSATYYQKASENIESSETKLVLYHGLGLLYTAKNDLSNAALYFKNAEVLLAETKHKILPVRLPHDFAWIKEQENKLEEALVLYKKAFQRTLVLLPKQKDDSGNLKQYFIANNHAIARVLHKMNMPDSAFYYLDFNERMHTAPTPYFPKGYPYNNYNTSLWYGKIYTKKQDFKQAETALKKAAVQANKSIQNNHPDWFFLHQAFAENYFAQTLWDSTIKSCQKAIQVLIEDYPLQDIHALPDYEKTPMLKELWEIILLKSKVLNNQGKKELAYKNIQHAIKIIEKIQKGFNTEDSKLFITSVTIPTYEIAIDLALELGDKEATFVYAEQSKSALLLGALKTSQAKQFGNIPDSLIQKETQLGQDLAAYEKQLFDASRSKDTAVVNYSQPRILKLRKEITTLQKLFETNYPKYYELKYAPQIATVKKTMAHLNDTTTLLEYFVGDSSIYVFGIQKNNFTVRKIKKDATFDNTIDELYKSLTKIENLNSSYDKMLQSFASNAYDIFKKYVQPDINQGHRQLFVIPSGQLAYIPFEVLLQESSNNEDDFRTLNYLLKNHTINYYYSASLMLYHHPSLANNGQILAMAASYTLPEGQADKIAKKNPKEGFLRKHLKEIPGTKREVQELETRFHGKFLLDKDANETNFKDFAQSDAYSIIHMAMHGVVDKKNPEYSCMALTKSSTDSLTDDLLHAYEINLLKLQASLVVLSACETGYGKNERGEGVISIGRGFMYAGVPSLIMTLWPLNDASGAFLIKELYDGLQKGEYKDQALRHAKLKWLAAATDRTTAHPFFWASFVTLGDNSPIYVNQRGFLKDNWMYLTGVGLLLVGLGGFVFRRKEEVVS